MIFVTVGSSLPFDRLIQAADAWAAGTDRKVFAQTGEGVYTPRHMDFSSMLTPGEFSQRVRAASLIVAHAGMGTVISAMEAGKPIVVLPRRAADREVTTDHQIHTANWLRMKPGVFVADTEAQLAERIEAALSAAGAAPSVLNEIAPQELIGRIRGFLWDGHSA